MNFRFALQTHCPAAATGHVDSGPAVIPLPQSNDKQGAEAYIGLVTDVADTV
jgi:hypothetical protein